MEFLRHFAGLLAFTACLLFSRTAYSVEVPLRFFDSFSFIRVEGHLLPPVSTGPMDPDWHPSITWLAFSMAGDIWKIPVTGGEAVALTKGPYYYFEPAWSPDGKQLAVTVDYGGNLDIALLDAAGGNLQRITDDPGVDFQPVWGKDGASVYFVSSRYGDLDIHRVSLEARAVEPVVTGRGHQIQPAISPDGTHIAYISPVSGRIGSGAIWCQQLSGGEPEMIHYEETSYRAGPVWTADGRALIFSSDGAGNNDIVSIPAAGGVPLRLTSEPWDEWAPAVSRFASTIAYVSNIEGISSIFTINSGGAGNNAKKMEIHSRKRQIETGRVIVTVVDEDKQPIAARIQLTASDGRGYAPAGEFHRVISTSESHYFHTHGRFEIELPVGTARIEAFKGFEFAPAVVELSVTKDVVAQAILSPARIIDPRMRGWYSGDTHLHDLHQGRFGLDHNHFFRQIAAEDIHVANSLIHMDGTKLMGRWSDLSGEPHPLSTGQHILRYSQEFRGSFGHIGMLGIRQFVMPLISGTGATSFAAEQLNVRYIDAANAQGGIAGFMHPYNRQINLPTDAANAEIPVDLALGRGDFYDVVCVWSDELASAEMYYKFLNTGARVAATGGTDSFANVWRDPPVGTGRTYARLEGPLTFANWIAAVRAGRTFATNGPLVFFTVEGRQPGEEIRLPADGGGAFKVHAEVISQAPLDRLEIIVNGQIADTIDAAGEGNRFSVERILPIDSGGWIAARVIGKANRFVADSYPFAQTSPVYVTLGDKKWRSVADARFLLDVVDELWKRVESRDRWNSDAGKTAYESAIWQARSYYATIAEGSGEGMQTSTESAGRAALLDPSGNAMNQRAPELYRVNFNTTKGEFIVEIHRRWAPFAADRIFNLVRNGYFDDMRIFRVRPGYIAQFGVHGDPEIAAIWRNLSIPDDVRVVSNKRASVGLAMTAVNTRTTQVYINYQDNSAALDRQGFAPFGEVVKGMDIVDAFYGSYGESAGGGMRRGQQDRLFAEGNDLLDRQFPDLDSIITATIVER